MLRFILFCEGRSLLFLDKRFPSLATFVRKHERIVKYLFSGGTAAVIDLGLLYVLTDIAGFHYLVSATLAFLLAFMVSFTLQKFWTFSDKSVERIPVQLVLYLSIAAANIFVNAGLMYVLVDILGVWYFLGQIIAGATMACYGFLLYRHVIFQRQPDEIANHNPKS